ELPGKQSFEARHTLETERLDERLWKFRHDLLELGAARDIGRDEWGGRDEQQGQQRKRNADPKRTLESVLSFVTQDVKGHWISILPNRHWPARTNTMAATSRIPAPARS